MFMTNNSSKNTSEYIKKMAALGISASEQDFITSIQSTIQYLKSGYENELLYALGTAAFREDLSAAGLNITDQVEDGISCLVMGFDTELTFRKLEDACILLGRGVDYVAANPDLVCPTEFGYVPDCGSVSVMLKNATGREPVFIGKPKPEMVYAALERTGFTKEQTLIVGDRLYTDIACGIAAGVDTALVLSGETKREDIAGSPHKPTYVFGEIEALLAAMKGGVTDEYRPYRT